MDGPWLDVSSPGEPTMPCSDTINALQGCPFFEKERESGNRTRTGGEDEPVGQTGCTRETSNVRRLLLAAYLTG